MKHLCLFVLALLLLATLIKAEPYKLSIIHTNDLHARFEPTDSSGGTCSSDEKCIGGYARIVFTIRRLLDEHKNENVLYLNAGDNFQGTLWYYIGRWNVTSQILNILPADAMTLGNHEFDNRVKGAVPFLETLNTPVLVANMDSKNEPTIEGKYKKSMIIEKGNRKIGVIGVTVETLNDSPSTENLIFRNEIDAIHEEAEKLKAQGANIIIVISHCGYDVDKLIAQHTGSEIDVIVGAHTHTFLYTGDTLPGPDKPSGDYPTEVIHESGHRVLIVQAAAHARYVGYLEVTFDEAGNVLSHDGAPIYMDSTVPEDQEVITAMQPWKEFIDTQANVVIGTTKLDMPKAPCSSGECNLGNFFCDAMIHAFVKLSPYDAEAWTSVSIALTKAGAMRVPLSKGNLTFSHLVAMLPYENILTAFNLRGDKLIEALEFSVKEVDIAAGINSSSLFFQVAGLKITFNFAKPVGSRVVDVKVRCAKCIIPFYETIDKSKIYRIVAPDNLVKGGDGFFMLRDYATDLQYGMTDLEAVMDYTKIMSPIFKGTEDRITVINE